MHTLLFYLQQVRQQRCNAQVFVSNKTFRAVTSSIIARWLKTVLELSGIDFRVFKAHSFRSATTSCAFGKGCTLKRKLDTADWRSDKNFRKFYFRETVKVSSLSFTQAVFTGNSWCINITHVSFGV